MRHIDQIVFRMANKACYMPLALGAAEEVARMLGFGAEDVRKIRLGVEEALAYVVEYGYLPGELAWFDVVFATVPLGLQVTIREQGVPIDEQELAAEREVAPERLLAGPGLGLKVLKSSVDSVSFRNLGHKGQEIRLVKYFPEAAETGAGGEPAALAGRATAAASDYIVRPLAPEEAVEVAKCAYSSYGYTYGNEHIYYPQRVRELNRTGKLVSYVAVTTGEEPEIIGHAALETGDERHGVEMGVAFVKPAFRGNGCLLKISEALIEAARAADMDSLFVGAVTSHAMSQRTASRMGFAETALLLSRVSLETLRDIKEDNTQRESLLVFTRYLKGGPADAPLYPPPRHRAMIAGIYGRSGAPRTLATAGRGGARGPAAVETATDSYHAAHIYVHRYGTDVRDQVAAALRMLCVNRVETIYLYLSLTDPETARQTARFEESGFFFGGVFPGRSGRDWLVLQYLNNQRLDYGQLRTATEAGREIVEYVRACDPNQ
jgi:anti-sigma regulatory factor (Ser/Thr protein kinase)/GNAT superfamily N-acetyltransferase